MKIDHFWLRKTQEWPICESISKHRRKTPKISFKKKSKNIHEICIILILCRSFQLKKIGFSMIWFFHLQMCQFIFHQWKTIHKSKYYQPDFFLDGGSMKEVGWRRKGSTVHLSSPSMAAINPKPRKRRGGVCLSRCVRVARAQSAATACSRPPSPSLSRGLPAFVASVSFPSPFRYGGHPNPRRGV